MDRGFEKWTNDALVFIAQLFEGSTFKSFEQIQEEFKLQKRIFINICNSGIISRIMMIGKKSQKTCQG